MDVKHSFALVNGVRLHYVSQGSKDNPLLVLLHGFPQFWYAWRHQIPALSNHFNVVAVDLRGYNESDKPTRVADYTSQTIAKDIADLIKELGYDRASVVGHDWGGVIAWQLALLFPELINKLAILNCPHPYMMKNALRSNLRQIVRSWYIFFFQLPFIPEFIFSLNPKGILKALLQKSTVRKDTFSDADIEEYLNALEKPGTPTSIINYYRSALRNSSDQKLAQIQCPTLIIWGEEDVALGKELTYNMEPLFNNTFSIKYIPKCSHWVNEEQPETVNQLLLDFFTSPN